MMYDLKKEVERCVQSCCVREFYDFIKPYQHYLTDGTGVSNEDIRRSVNSDLHCLFMSFNQRQQFLSRVQKKLLTYF